VAARQLNGLIIPAGAIFSFWKNVGRATRRAGFVTGRELREGCLIPNVGGGLCQLSNALYDVALRANCKIVERHAHSQALPALSSQHGRDATVFWNYVDFRFAPSIDCQLRVELTRGELVVALHSLVRNVRSGPSSLGGSVINEPRPETAQSCESCNVAKCFRHSAAVALPRHGTVAWIVDKFEPEFDEWMRCNRRRTDTLMLPMRRGNYRWDTTGFSTVTSAPLVALRRSWHARRQAEQGAARQSGLLESDRLLAIAFARSIPYTADHLVISQNLLPHLWRRGDLGGRTFDVLMTRLPIVELERTLDAASAANPRSRTLSDFRSPVELREAETEALSAARFWVTPHSAIARLGGERSIKLDWRVPSKTRLCSRGQSIVFPASTLARKGCYELREAAQQLGLGIVVTGRTIEAPDFWHDSHVKLAGPNWLSDAAIVVLPAWVEHWPRHLLQAAAAGIPVIASQACGLEGVENVIECASGDVPALRSHLFEILSRIPA
jgi:hypothetical protein